VTVRRPAATQIHSSLLSISVGAVLMPAAYHYSLSWRTDTASTDQKSAILKMSHGVGAFFLQCKNTLDFNVLIKVSVVLVIGAISTNEVRRIPIIAAQYIVATSSFNCGRTHIFLRIQIGPADLPSRDLICTSGSLNSERRKKVVRAALSRVQAFAPPLLPHLNA
jgi:hypothetical protein